MKDLGSNVKMSRALSPVAIGTNTTTVSETVDRQGFDSLAFVIASGVLTDGAYAWKVFEGDDPSMSDEAEATGTKLSADAPTWTATADHVVAKVGYFGQKRYLRVKVVSTDVTTGGLVAVIALQGLPQYAPV